MIQAARMEENKSQKKNIYLTGISISILAVLLLWSAFGGKICPNCQNCSSSNQNVSGVPSVSGLVQDLSPDSFNKAIKEQAALIDFWAPWCQACKIQDPILNDVSVGIGNQAVIAKVDVQEQRELASQYNIQYLPTLLLFSNGREMKRFIGVQNKEILIAEIKKLQQEKQDVR